MRIRWASTGVLDQADSTLYRRMTVVLETPGTEPVSRRSPAGVRYPTSKARGTSARGGP
jgi:hypothetical protein